MIILMHMNAYERPNGYFVVNHVDNGTPTTAMSLSEKAVQLPAL